MASGQPQQPQYIHPADNPLLGPLTQLGTSIDTNYTNSWTLRRLIQDNAQYILAQLDRIRLSVTQLQQDLASHRDQVQILQQQILDLREQLAAAMAAGQSEETLRQQITALTTQRNDYIRWINDSLALINRYNAYVQHINGLAPDNAQITNLIGQINQRLRQVTDLFSLSQDGQDPPPAPGPPPPYNGQGQGQGQGGTGGQGSGILGTIGDAFSNLTGSSSSSSSQPSSASSSSNQGPRRNPLSQPPQGSSQSSSTNLAKSFPQSTNFNQVNPMMQQQYNVGDMVNFNNNGRPINGRITFVSPIDGTYTIMDPQTTSSYPNVPQNNIVRKFKSSSGGKRKRTRKQRKYKGGWRLNSSKRTSSQTPSSRTSSRLSSRTSSRPNSRRKIIKKNKLSKN